MNGRIVRRRLGAAACALVLSMLPLAGCGTSGAGSSATTDADALSATSGQPQGPTITIGVSSDLPGLGYWHDGSYSGFDIDVAAYVAKVLGYGRKQIVFVQVRPQERATALDGGRADMVVAGFTMTDEAAKNVAFAGSYLDVRPAVLVHDDETLGGDAVADLFDTTDSGTAIADQHDVAVGHDKTDGDVRRDMTVCAVNGTAERAMIAGRDDVTVKTYDTYGQCMTALMAGSVDMVAGDEATLPGLMHDRRGSYRLVTDSSDDDGLSYGIAVRHDRTELAGKITAALRAMLDDGSWRQYVDADLMPFGYRPSPLSSPTVTTY
ncbi:transporter substrate-binding domain-containing protein [Bifidobacterium simiiventris]|uniref:transporter substrate-binding domain-containing protein n=1 Tax=Bifidobacterium simiiventris TaxID=2834434 RepID=UPI001C57A925|nr:transporter substrate-binding domain-containing protein [Bifidobacterium simiiventris]